MPPIMFMYFINPVVNKYHGSFFCGIDIHDWIVRFLDLGTCAISCHVSINISLLIWKNPHIDSRNLYFNTDPYIWITIHNTVQHTNQVLESIVP